uniref:Uncharacterized protein n=1 Tax=Knipowitschia caucasica TaxID=637954 RepID=A0AAV2JZV4_KNICA
MSELQLSHCVPCFKEELGNVSFQCSGPPLGSCTFLSSTSSFLSLPSLASSSALGVFSVRFHFRTWNADGMLLSAPLRPDPHRPDPHRLDPQRPDPHRLELHLSDSRLLLTLQTPSRHKSQVFTGQNPPRLIATCRL